MGTFLAVLPLTPHPEMAPVAIGSVACSISWKSAGQWCFDYIVGEPPEALRLPAPVSPARADRLWERTCFELFLRRPDADSYYEFNFSPSGEWAGYRFDSYRSGMAEIQVAPPRIVSTDPKQFDLAMSRHLAELGVDPESVSKLLAVAAVPGPGPVGQYALSACLDDASFGAPGPWLAAISAVIEESDGTKSYWGLNHPPGEPDFHHPDCFVLDLPPPDPA